MRTARFELGLFLGLTFLLSSPFYALILFGDAPQWTSGLSHLFMWMPGLAAVITMLVTRRSVLPLGFRLGRLRYYAVCYLVPIAFCVPVYLFTWLSGLGRFDPNVIEKQLGLRGAAAGVAVAVLLPLFASAGILATLGEELGWSGVLTPRLLDLTTFTRASLIRGMIWSLWHYPLIAVLLPRYRPGLPVWYALTCMTVSITAISFVYTWLRVATGSVWPAALLHAVSSGFQEFFEAVTKNTGPTYWITFEFGAGFAVVLSLIAWGFATSARRGADTSSTGHPRPAARPQSPPASGTA